MADLKSPGLSRASDVQLSEVTGSIGVLMVDDQPSRLLTYEAILSNLAVRCVWALSGTEALEHLLKDRFAVILLDVNMPGMDGFELARLIREHPRLERTPIIFITAVHVSELDRLKGYEVGAVDYISVPVVPEILRSKVAVLVELHQRRAELQHLNRELAEARARLEAEHVAAIAMKDAQLRAVFEHPSDITVVVRARRDAEGAIVGWNYHEANANAAALLGRTKETLLERDLVEVLGERAGAARKRCERVLTTGQPERYETRFGGRDFLTTIFPIGDDCVVSSGVDITERKRVEAALRDSEHRLMIAKRAAQLGTYDWNMRTGELQWDERTYELWGIPFGEPVSYDTFFAAVHRDDRDRVQRSVTAALDPKGEGKYFITMRVIGRTDGMTRWIEATGQVFFEDDRAVRLVGTTQDITERTVADDKLRDSEERFRVLANSIHQFAWTCDRDGQRTWYNDRWYEYSGTTFDEMRGFGWKRLHHPDHLPRVLAHLEDCLVTGRPWEDTFPLRRKDGVYRWFLTRAVPIRDESGQVIRWFGTNTDVTDLRELQDALKETDRRKDEFLAMLAHELRNPVAPISNAADVLSRVLGDDDGKRALVEIVRRQANHLSRLLDDLLDIARITQGRIDLRRAVIPLSTCIQQAIETAEPLVREKGHRLTVSETFPPTHVDADKIRLAQSIGNVLLNAAKYTNPGGEIRVKSFADAGQAVVEISDTGVGIAPELLPKVFDLFVQSERTLDRTLGGLGIGLAVCKQLVEMHGGTVSARSAGIGAGATFTIRVPLVEPAVDAARSNGETSIMRQRVLIVDDNQDSADSLAILLELEGHESRAVYSAATALEQVATFQPDVVLLDIGLPEMDGYEVARRIRELPRPPRLIAVSGYGQPEERQRSAAAGFSAHLVKPVDIATLKKVLSD